MKKVLLVVLVLAAVMALIGCGNGFRVQDLPPMANPTPDDPYYIVDRAQVVLEGSVDGGVARVKIKKITPLDLFISTAYAYTGSTAPSATITAISYNNPATTVGFTLNTSGLVAGSFTGNTLSFGNFAISGLDDNNLKVCPAAGEANGGNVKCNKAKIRVYSATGSVDGVFHNNTDNYDIPLTVGGTAVGVGVANAAYVQTYVIAANKNRLRVADLTAATANFPVAMDFSNAGVGSYSATLIVEYVLIKE